MLFSMLGMSESIRSRLSILTLHRKNSRLKDSLKAETKAQLEEVDDELLTIRGLMNKAESRKIVDDPRDYQLELLERAKKENTIAVLDTGSCAPHEH